MTVRARVAALTTLLALATALAAAAEGGGLTFDEHHDVGSGPHAAGIVVDTGEEVKAVCVRFAEEEITGEELLDRTGLDVVWAYYGDLGAAACAICGVGCPADDCHCETPFWWSYWQGDGEGGWTSSPVGASTRKVRDGDMDARLWHDGSRHPPEVSFSQVCAADAPPPGRPDAEAANASDRTGGPTAAEIRGLVWLALTLLAVLGAVFWRRRQRSP